jgi:hypothetical protein
MNIDTRNVKIAVAAALSLGLAAIGASAVFARTPGAAVILFGCLCGAGLGIVYACNEARLPEWIIRVVRIISIVTMSSDIRHDDDPGNLDYRVALAVLQLTLVLAAAVASVIGLGINNPTALVLIGLAIIDVCSTLILSWFFKCKSKFPPNRCRECDYDLTGLPRRGRCPECGVRFKRK